MNFSLLAFAVLLLGTLSLGGVVNMYNPEAVIESMALPGTAGTSCAFSGGDYISFYYNIKVDELPSVIENVTLDLEVVAGSSGSDSEVLKAKAAIVRAVPENFKLTDSDPKDFPDIFNPEAPYYPVFVTDFVDDDGKATKANLKLVFDFSKGSKKAFVFDRHTFLYVVMRKCFFTLKYTQNDNQFIRVTIGDQTNVTFSYYGSGLVGSYFVSTKSPSRSDLISAGMREEFSLTDYYDDICTCNFGIPDLACQNPEIGPADAQGCVGNELCVLDTCVAGVKGSKDINCPYRDQHFGNDELCECGCLGDARLPDIDCFYPNRFYMQNFTHSDSPIKVGKFHGVVGTCNFPDVTCTNELWKCPMSMYNDSEKCDCFCGYMDEDCFNKDLPTDCHDDFVCYPTNYSDWSTQECLAPKAWTCDPNAYNMTGNFSTKTTSCFCNCSVGSPACFRAESIQIYCGPGGSVTYENGYTCLANATCVPNGCGSGVFVGSSRKCDGGFMCDANCACPSPYKEFIPPQAGCRTPCGDLFVKGDEECDRSIFCDNITCKCLPGHEWIEDQTVSGHCRGCGNLVIEPGEECDGGEGCLSNCLCDEYSGYSPSDKEGSVDCVKTSSSVPTIAGAAIGAFVLIVTIVILFIIVNHYKTDEQKAARKIRQSENAIKSAKSQNSKITFDSKSALNPQPKSAGPDPSILSQLNVSTQGGGMELDDEED